MCARVCARVYVCACTCECVGFGGEERQYRNQGKRRGLLPGAVTWGAEASTEGAPSQALAPAPGAGGRVACPPLTAKALEALAG